MILYRPLWPLLRPFWPLLRPFWSLLKPNSNKFELFDQLRAKFDHRLWSNSNFEAKFDLKFEFRIRHFQSNSEFFPVLFEIRPSLVWGGYPSSCLSMSSLFIFVVRQIAKNEIFVSYQCFSTIVLRNRIFHLKYNVNIWECL